MFTTRFCADSVRAHQPAELDEEAVRVGVLLLRAVDLFHALGGLLAAQTHAVLTQSSPSVSSHSYNQASDRHRAEAHYVGHSQDVVASPCHVCG